MAVNLNFIKEFAVARQLRPGSRGGAEEKWSEPGDQQSPPLGAVWRWGGRKNLVPVS